MNLFPPAASASQQRPHQQGTAHGTKSGVPVSAPAEWMIDTGAELGCVRHALGSHFDLVATGASASPTTGGTGILVMTGLEAEFAAEDPLGVSHALRAAQPVAVKSNNAGSDIVGMDQLASQNVSVSWDPQGLRGSLTIPLAGAGPTSSSAGSQVAAAPDAPADTVAIVDHGTYWVVGGVRVDKRPAVVIKRTKG